MTVARCGFICVQQRIRRRHVAVEICTGTLPQRYKRSAKPLARSSTTTCANQMNGHYSGTRTVVTSSATNVPLKPSSDR